MLKTDDNGNMLCPWCEEGIDIEDHGFCYLILCSNQSCPADFVFYGDTLEEVLDKWNAPLNSALTNLKDISTQDMWIEGLEEVQHKATMDMLFPDEDE